MNWPMIITIGTGLIIFFWIIIAAKKSISRGDAR